MGQLLYTKYGRDLPTDRETCLVPETWSEQLASKMHNTYLINTIIKEHESQ